MPINTTKQTQTNKTNKTNNTNTNNTNNEPLQSTHLQTQSQTTKTIFSSQPLNQLFNHESIDIIGNDNVEIFRCIDCGYDRGGAHHLHGQGCQAIRL